MVRVTISRGQLAKIIAKVSTALDGPYQELLDTAARRSRCSTWTRPGHKDNGTLMWTWCFRASLYTLFKIDPHRSADVLIEVLGKEFDGVLGCDCFSAYRRYMREFDVVVQFCLAHLIRDVKFLTTLPGKKEQAYGSGCARRCGRLFGLIHRREQMPAEQFQRQLEAARDGVLQVGTSRTCRQAGTAQAMAKRLREVRRELLHVRDDAGGGADEQPGGAGDPVRGDRPAHHAGDAKRDGAALVRADLDGDGDVCAAGTQRVRLPERGGEVVLRGRGGPVAAGRGLRKEGQGPGSHQESGVRSNSTGKS